MAFRYWVGGNSTWDATAGTKWALTSGGVGGLAVPTSSDAVFLDNGTGHGNVTIAIVGAVCASLDCTGYTDTLTITTSNSVIVSGSITLGAGMGTSSDGTGAMICLATGTLTSNGIICPWSVTLRGTSQTFTLADAWSTTSSLTTSGAVTAVTLNGNTFTAAGNVNLTTAATVSGTTTIIITGGQWKSTGGGILNNSVTINGNVTVVGTVPWGGSGKVLTYTSGTVTTTGSTLSVQSSCTLNTAGIVWDGAFLGQTGAYTMTLNSLFTCTGTMQIGDHNGTWTGTAGFTVGRLFLTGSGDTISLKQGNTYTITNAFALTGGSGSHIILTSSDGTNKVLFILQPGASQSVSFVDAVRLDSSNAEGIYTSGGLLTTSFNWFNTYPFGQFFCGA